MEAEKVTMNIIQQMQDINWNENAVDTSEGSASRGKQRSDLERSADNPDYLEVTEEAENCIESTDASLSDENDLNDKLDETKDVDKKNANEDFERSADNPHFLEVTEEADNCIESTDVSLIDDNDLNDKLDETKDVDKKNANEESEPQLDVAKNTLRVENSGYVKGSTDDDQRGFVDKEPTDVSNDSSNLCKNNKSPVQHHSIDQTVVLDSAKIHVEEGALLNIASSANSFKDCRSDEAVESKNRSDYEDREQTDVNNDSNSLSMENKTSVQRDINDQTNDFDAASTYVDGAALSNFKSNADSDENCLDSKDRKRTGISNDSSSLSMENKTPVEPNNNDQTKDFDTSERNDGTALSHVENNANSVEDSGNEDSFGADNHLDSKNGERKNVGHDSDSRFKKSETSHQKDNHDQINGLESVTTNGEEAALSNVESNVTSAQSPGIDAGSVIDNYSYSEDDMPGSPSQTPQDEDGLHLQGHRGPILKKIEILNHKQRVNLSGGSQISPLLQNRKRYDLKKVATPSRQVDPIPKRLHPKNDDGAIESSQKPHSGKSKQSLSGKSMELDRKDQLNRRSEPEPLNKHSLKNNKQSLKRGAHDGQRTPSVSGKSVQSVPGTSLLNISDHAPSKKPLKHDEFDQLDGRSHPGLSKQHLPESRKKSLNRYVQNPPTKTSLPGTSTQSSSGKLLPEKSKQAPSKKSLKHDASLKRDAQSPQPKTSLSGTAVRSLSGESLSEKSKQAPSKKLLNSNKLNRIDGRSQPEISKPLEREAQGTQRKTLLSGAQKHSSPKKSLNREGNNQMSGKPGVLKQKSGKLVDREAKATERRNTLLYDKSKQTTQKKNFNSGGRDLLNQRLQPGPPKQRLSEKNGKSRKRNAQGKQTETSDSETSEQALADQSKLATTQKTSGKNHSSRKNPLNQSPPMRLPVSSGASKSVKRSLRPSLQPSHSEKPKNNASTQPTASKSVKKGKKKELATTFSHDSMACSVSDDDNASIETRPQESSDKKSRLKRKTLLTFPAEDLDKILHLGKQLVNTVKLIIQNAERVDEFGDKTLLRKLPEPEEETGRIETAPGMSYDCRQFAAASTATNMRARVKHLVYGLWDADTRMKLVMQRRKNNVAGCRVVTNEEVEEIISTALKLQGIELLERDGLADTSAARKWISEILKMFRFHSTHRDKTKDTRSDNEEIESNEELEDEGREDQQVEDEEDDEIQEAEDEDEEQDDSQIVRDEEEVEGEELEDEEEVEGEELEDEEEVEEEELEDEEKVEEEELEDEEEEKFENAEEEEIDDEENEDEQD